MNKYKILLSHPIALDEQKRRLAQVYTLIMSWPDPLEKEPADSENFDRNAETAEVNAPTCESEADLV